MPDRQQSLPSPRGKTFSFPEPSSALEFTGERYVTGLVGDIQSEHYHRYLMALRYCEGRDVLDVACGEGYGAVLLGQVANSVVGVDLDRATVEHASRHYAAPHVTFRTGDATAVPLAAGAVDTVVSFETIEHIADHAAFLAEVRRVLRPGGTLVISSPDRAEYTEKTDHHNPFHLKELSRAEFLDLLQAHFAHVVLLEQRALSGSVILRAAETGHAGPVEGFETHDGAAFTRLAGVPEAPYLIAVCSDAALPEVASSVMQTPVVIWRLEELRQRAEAETARLRREAEAGGARLRHETGAEATRLLHEAEADAARLRRDIEAHRHQVEDLQGRLSETAAMLEQVTSSTMWRATGPLRRGLARLPGVARLGRRSFNALRLARHGMLLPRLKQEIAGRKELSWIANVFRRPEPPPPEPVVVAPSAGVHDPVREVASYRAMRQRIAAQRADRLGAVRVEPLALMQVAGSDLAAVAAGLRFAKSDAPVVSIVVPAYNNVALTLECLMALNRFTAADIPFEVIVADDCSTDRTAELIAAIEGVVHIRNERNLHFLRTCNAAARHARGEFLVFLNNDVQVTKGWLPPLLDVFRDERAAGAAGPRILYPGGHLQEAGVLVNPDATARMIGLDGDPNEPRYRFKRRVDYCSGACLMVPAARFRELGGFDEALAPAYCEDMDLCLRLRGLGLDVWYVPQSTVAHHLSRTTAQGGNDAKMRMIVANQQKVMESRQREIESLNDVRLFAFYLPQFHPIPENDRWWGAGFTEWTNVTRAVPQYDGHDQPKLPADLGFYDLRIASVMEQQAELARRYGISGFCFYYYWFAGHRLLETPIERMLSSGSPDFPFFLCWANENWTRRWDGQESEMLIAQEHSPEDDLAVIRDLMRYMRDPRYVRIGGKPLLLVYRVGLFPDFAATAARWRAACRAEGLGEIYLAAVESFSHSVDGGDMRVFGVDAAVQFPPHGHPPPWRPEGRRVRDDFQGRLYDYEGAALQFLDARFPAMPRFPGVIPAWDNTARRMSNAAIFDGAGPGAFQAWLEEAILQTREHNAPDERIVFINAWNEWAEGACLEPDRVHGHAWLEAVRNARDAQRLRRD